MSWMNLMMKKALAIRLIALEDLCLLIEGAVVSTFGPMGDSEIRQQPSLLHVPTMYPTPPTGDPPAAPIAEDAERFRELVQRKMVQDGWPAAISDSTARNAAAALQRPRTAKNLQILLPNTKTMSQLESEVCFRSHWIQNGWNREELTCFLRNPMNSSSASWSVPEGQPPAEGTAELSRPPLLPMDLMNLRVGSVETLDITQDWLVVRFLSSWPQLPKEAPRAPIAPTPPTTSPSRQVVKIAEAPPPAVPLPPVLAEAKGQVSKFMAPAFRFFDRFKQSWESGKSMKVVEKVMEEGFGFRGNGELPDGGRMLAMVKQSAVIWKRWLKEAWTDLGSMLPSRPFSSSSKSDSSKNGNGGNSGGSS